MISGRSPFCPYARRTTKIARTSLPILTMLYREKLAKTNHRPGIDERLLSMKTVGWPVECTKVEAMVRGIAAWVAGYDDVIACLKQARPKSLIPHHPPRAFALPRSRQAPTSS